jgi:3',5'-cyclic AMP phosphodiesterase CpdA
LVISRTGEDSLYIAPVFAGFDRLDEGNGKFVFIGDTQGTSILEFWRESNKKKTPHLMAKIAQLSPAFVINLGDLVFCGANMKQWRRFDRAHQPLLNENIPYFPLPGNHEYWCNPEKSFERYFQHFPYLDNRKWYSFRFKSIGFILLDSNFSKLTEQEKDRQLGWYHKTLDEMNGSPDIHYVIVCCHNPPYTNSKVVDADEGVREHFVTPFLKKKKAVAFLSGHCHSYEKFIKGDKYFIVSGGGGGPRQKLNVNKKKCDYYPDLYDGPAKRFLHFCQVGIDPDGLTVKVMKLTKELGFEEADAFCIPRPKAK